MRKVLLPLLAVFGLALASARMVRAEGAGEGQGQASQPPVLPAVWSAGSPYPGYVWLTFSLPRPACHGKPVTYAVHVVSLHSRTAALAFPAHNTLVPCGQGRVQVAVLVRPEDAPFRVWVERAFDGSPVQVWGLETPGAGRGKEGTCRESFGPIGPVGLKGVVGPIGPKI